MEDFPQAANRRIRQSRRESDASRLAQALSPIESGALEDAALDDIPKADRAAHATDMNRVQKARNDERRTAEKATAFTEIGVVSDREPIPLGVALHWAEGAKEKPHARREVVTFINSDPGMIRLFLRWLDLMGIEERRRRYRASIHESADVAAAEDYWPAVVGVVAPAILLTHGLAGTAAWTAGGGNPCSARGRIYAKLGAGRVWPIRRSVIGNAPDFGSGSYPGSSPGGGAAAQGDEPVRATRRSAAPLRSERFAGRANRADDQQVGSVPNKHPPDRGDRCV